MMARIGENPLPREVWGSALAVLIGLYVDLEADRVGREPGGVGAPSDLLRLEAIRRVREVALAAEDLELAAMQVPDASRPRYEAVGQAMGMSRQNARKRMLTAWERVREDTAALEQMEFATQAESQFGGILRPARTLREVAGIIDGLSALLGDTGDDPWADQFAGLAGDLLTLASLFPDEPQTFDIGWERARDWEMRLKGALGR